MPNLFGRVLIVDGIPNARPALRLTLESAGYAVDEAGDGRTALERLNQSPADVVLIDLRKQGGVGMDVLRQLRRENNYVPVVIASSRGRPFDVVAATSLGVIDFLFTPEGPAALKDLVAEVVRRHNGPRAASPTSPEQTAARISGLFTESLTRAKRAMNRRDFRQAEQFLRLAVALEKDSATAQGLLGVIHESRGEWGQAARCYEAAYRADPRQEFTRLNMLRAYNRE